MNKIGIIGALEKEIEAIRQEMEIEESAEIGGRFFHSGKIGAMNVILCCSSIGKVNAATAAQIMISSFQVEALINTGVAGSLSKDVQIGDLILSSVVSHHDVRIEQMNHFYPYTEQFHADPILLRWASEALEKQKNLMGKVHIGKIVSGEDFIDSEEEKKMIAQRFSPLCVEMEGAAIAHTAHMNEIPFLLIRSISDKADEEATINFKEFLDRTAKQSARLLTGMIN